MNNLSSWKYFEVLLPTAREGNVFIDICHSVQNQPHAYSVSCLLILVGYSVTCYGAVGTHPTGMLSSFKM